MTRQAPPWFPEPRGQKLAAYRTARQALERLLEGLEPDGVQLVTADLARGAADLVDSARRRQDPRLMLAAASRLEQLVAKLADETTCAATGGAEQHGEGVDDAATRLADLVGSPATVGDEA